MGYRGKVFYIITEVNKLRKLTDSYEPNNIKLNSLRISNRNYLSRTDP